VAKAIPTGKAVRRKEKGEGRREKGKRRKEKFAGSRLPVMDQQRRAGNFKSEIVNRSSFFFNH
jgi:hypothetical protein